MGCTSSAPNTLSAKQNLADEGVQNVDDSSENVLKTDAVETVGDIHSAVLPMCDVVETIVNNNKSSISLQLENDIDKQKDNFESEVDQTIEKPKDLEVEIEENLTKLEEVVEKVVELNQSNNDQQSEENSTEEPSNTDVEEEGSNLMQTLQETQTADEIEDGSEEQENAVEDNSEESSDQSEYSHATRWEALADIVAELPPSLAIDQVTGQIYSLTK